jgi:hypothetical protein
LHPYTLKEWRYINSLDEFLLALKSAMKAAEIDPDGSSAQAEWLRWLTEYRECVDPFEELFEEIGKLISGWHWGR